MMQIELRTKDYAYGRWTKVLIERSLDQLCSAFELTMPHQPEIPLIKASQPVEIWFNDAMLINGYIDEVEVNITATEQLLMIRGRDVAAPLLESQLPRGAAQRKNILLAELAEEICQPFGLSSLVVGDASQPFSQFTFGREETPFAALQRACRERDRIPVHDGLGHISLTQPKLSAKSVGTALVEGENLLAINYRSSVLERFHSYHAFAFAEGEHIFGNKTAPKAAVVFDKDVEQVNKRWYVSLPQSSTAELKQRVQWECNVARANGQVAMLSVKGWQHLDGLWAPQQLVEVHSPSLGLNSVLLISEVSQTLDEQGLRTELRCNPPEVWQVALPEIEPEQTNIFGRKTA